MGYLSGFVQGLAEFINDRNHFPGLYAQDSWKATPKLTINYGVRWEAFAPWSDSVVGGQTEFMPNNYVSGTVSNEIRQPAAGTVCIGRSWGLANGVGNQYKQFMPRVGFAYDVLGDGKTVIRGGGGIFYQDRLQGFFNLNQVAHVPYTLSVNQGAMGGAAVGGPFSNLTARVAWRIPGTRPT